MGLVCSYDEDSDPLFPCLNCFKRDVKCLAGPKSGRTRTGPSLDQCFVGVQRVRSPAHRLQNSLGACQISEPEGISSDPRSEAQCTQIYCDQCSIASKRWCSLSKESSKADCDYCKQNSFCCAPESAYARDLRRTRTEERNSIMIEERPIQAARRTSKPLQRQTIVTKLAHPIKFNYLGTEGDGTIGCHWCEDLYYGLQGFGKTILEVQDLGDAQGYAETGDGFTAAGFLPSRMCHGCTTERMSILVCKGHDMEALEGIDLFHPPHESYLDWLEPDKASSAPFIWCSICPAPASYKCGATDDFVLDTDDAMSPAEKGCGLHLCESCAIALVGEHDLQLENLIDKLEKDMEATEGIFELRADANFLHPRGELARRWPYLTDD